MTPPPKDMNAVWKDLSKLIESLPKEDYFRYLAAIRNLVHDLRHSVAIIYGVETILRNSLDESPTNQELLDSLHQANQRINELVSNFAKSFDREDTTPANLPVDFDQQDRD